MNFGQRKLPIEAAEKLRVCPVASVRPFALTLSPVYVFLRTNEKFLSVKGPLDFFTPEELERLAKYGNFFMPAFVDCLKPFRDAGKAVRTILGQAPTLDGTGDAALPPAPFETSDAVLRAIGPLWSPGGAIEPFFLAVFTEELCAPLPAETLTAARDREVRDFERAILISGALVFLALHLGYCDLSFLNLLRLEAFERVVSERDSLLLTPGSELRQLFGLAFELIGEDLVREGASVSRARFAQRPERAAQKLHSRLGRVESAMIRPDLAAPSIFGEGGFLDA